MIIYYLCGERIIKYALCESLLNLTINNYYHYNDLIIKRLFKFILVVRYKMLTNDNMEDRSVQTEITEISKETTS